ncbi:UvrD-helicase domain-containing protein [Kitasatospora sp. NPDC058032]|uniref:UvrD-helicase domain-containing protein n=1 Tax=Kitasatospora sp. NPDC058032 TaxID=3346307 RepID=UPI0036D9A29A
MSSKTDVQVSPQADADMRRLGRGARNAVLDFVRRVREDRTNRSLLLRPLRRVGSNGTLYTAVVDEQLMALLLETEGTHFAVLAIRYGPQVYEVLKGIQVEVNQVSGGIELIDPTQVTANVVILAEHSSKASDEASQVPQDAPARSGAVTLSSLASIEGQVPLRLPVPLFAKHDDETLIRLGLIASLLPSVRRLTNEDQLLALVEQNIPQLSKEVLLYLYDGKDPEQVREQVTRLWEAPEAVDPADWARAARRPVSQVSTEDPAVLAALGEGFEAWRLFLHPEQQRLATTDFKGSAKVTGGPGTGKTVVALHRVRHLVSKLPPGHTKPVLLTTFNPNLAADLKQRLDSLGGRELLARVDIKSVDQLAREVVVQDPHARIGRPIDDNAVRDHWFAVRIEAGEDEFDPEFLDAEWKHVILAQGLGNLRAYLRADRDGRGGQLQRPQRIRIWNLVEALTERLVRVGQVTWAQLASQAADIEHHRMARVEEQAHYKDEHGGVDLIHREASSGMWLKPRYRHIVVDEAQDLSASHWRMLRAMVAPLANDIFLVGDAHQRIYAHRVVLGRYGILTKGRSSRRLTLNYRTSRQILGSARGLIEGEQFDDLDEGKDSLDGYRSVLSGLGPQYYRSPDWVSEQRTIAELLRDRFEQHGTPWEAMAVSVPDRDSVTQLATTLSRSGIPATEIGPDGPKGREGVRIGTMFRFKGLEFQRVFLAGVAAGLFPDQRVEQYRHVDPKRYQSELQRARSLVFVAATRARDELIISWNGRPSSFLPPDAVARAITRSPGDLADGPSSSSAA